MSKSAARVKGGGLAAPPPNLPAQAEGHGHPEYEHKHEHSHQLIAHEHSTVPPHEHGQHDHLLPKHEHRSLQGELRGAVRALLRAIELGAVNAEQRQAIHAVRVVIGDAHGMACTHGKDPDGLYRDAVYDESDRLVCSVCGTVISTEASG